MNQYEPDPGSDGAADRNNNDTAASRCSPPVQNATRLELTVEQIAADTAQDVDDSIESDDDDDEPEPNHEPARPPPGFRPVNAFLPRPRPTNPYLPQRAERLSPEQQSGFRNERATQPSPVTNRFRPQNPYLARQAHRLPPAQLKDPAAYPDNTTDTDEEDPNRQPTPPTPRPRLPNPYLPRRPAPPSPEQEAEVRHERALSPTTVETPNAPTNVATDHSNRVFEDQPTQQTTNRSTRVPVATETPHEPNDEDDNMANGTTPTNLPARRQTMNRPNNHSASGRTEREDFYDDAFMSETAAYIDRMTPRTTHRDSHVPIAAARPTDHNDNDQSTFEATLLVVLPNRPAHETTQRPTNAPAAATRRRVLLDSDGPRPSCPRIHGPPPIPAPRAQLPLYGEKTIRGHGKSSGTFPPMQQSSICTISFILPRLMSYGLMILLQ
jgi:hypothetical protein